MTRTDEITAAPAGAAPAGAGTDTTVEEPEELLIEEISIDGMCGVY